MNDLTFEQKKYLYIVACALYSLMLFYALVHVMQHWKWGPVLRTKKLILLAVIAMLIMGIMDNASMIPYYNTPDAPIFALCSFPYVLTNYFMNTGYLIALFKWIEASKGPSSNIFRVKVIFVTINLLQLFALLGTAVTECLFYCGGAVDEGLDTIANALYITAIVVLAFIVSAGFFVYGLKIAFGLRKRMSFYDQSSARQELIFKATVQATLLSFTNFLGGVLAIFFSILSLFATFFDTLAIIIQIVFQLLLAFELLLMIRRRPKDQPKMLATTDT